MGARQELEKRIEKKKAEIAELEANLGKEKAFLQGMQESLRYFPKEDSDDAKPETVLRPGTDLFKAKEFIEKVGHPVYITKLLEGIGKEVTKDSRVSLSGNLSWYVRKGLIFTRPRPNTFGLIGMKEEAEGEMDSEETGESEVELSETSLPVQ